MAQTQNNTGTHNSPNTAPKPAAGSLKEQLAPLRQRIDSALAMRMPAAGRNGAAHNVEQSLARTGRGATDPPAVYDPIRHVVAAGGKRIRPILTLLCCQAVCKDPDRALPTAAGIELLHTFTLVHDDVMDNDMTRRGHPTVHALWGGPLAITAGDGLYALAMETIADNEQHKEVSADVALALTRRAAQVSFEICAGQADDILFERSDRVDLAAYMEMIRLKTGVLIGLSTEAGARIGGASRQDVERLALFGNELGLAFQITDDLLDLIGQEPELGKPIGSDIRAGKKTYPVLHALSHLSVAERQQLVDILHTPEAQTTSTMVGQALRLIDGSGALEAAAKTAERHIETGKQALQAVGGVADRDAVAMLEAIADYIIHRTA